MGVAQPPRLCFARCESLRRVCDRRRSLFGGINQDQRHVEPPRPKAPRRRADRLGERRLFMLDKPTVVGPPKRRPTCRRGRRVCPKTAPRLRTCRRIFSQAGTRSASIFFTVIPILSAMASGTSHSSTARTTAISAGLSRRRWPAIRFISIISPRQIWQRPEVSVLKPDNDRTGDESRHPCRTGALLGY